MAQILSDIVYLTTTELPQTTTEYAKATNFPVNGFGGDFYNTSFEAPTYNGNLSGVTSDISWAAIDYWGLSTANILATEGIGLGLCLTTLFYIIALTPATKRGKPFHTVLILALVLQIFRSLCEIVQGSKLGSSQFSSYLFLTQDYASTTYSTNFNALRVMSSIISCFTIALTLICLGIQSSGLLSGIQTQQPKVYQLLMVYLILASFCALCWRIVYTALTITSIVKIKFNFNDGLVRHGMLISYSISIGSWSLVSLCSTIWLIWRRANIILSSNRLYNSVLNLIALICVESFVVPLIFCILQLLPTMQAVIQPELVVIPSVLVLLPLGSLFMTVHQAEMLSSSLSTNQNVRSPHQNVILTSPQNHNSPITDIPNTEDVLQIEHRSFPLQPVNKAKPDGMKFGNHSQAGSPGSERMGRDFV